MPTRLTVVVLMLTIETLCDEFSGTGATQVLLQT